MSIFIKSGGTWREQQASGCYYHSSMTFPTKEEADAFIQNAGLKPGTYSLTFDGSVWVLGYNYYCDYDPKTRIRVGGTWKVPSDSLVKVGGVWRSFDIPKPLPAFTLTHSGAGIFTIVGYDPTYTYVVSGGTGSVTGDVLTVDDPNGIVMVKAQLKKAESPPTYAQRKAYTYHQECHQECSPHCDGICMNCFNGSSCSGCQGPQVGCNGDGSCGADGCICCGGSRGQDCHEVCDTVRDATPANFDDQFGEWTRTSDQPLTDVRATRGDARRMNTVSTTGGALNGMLSLPLDTAPADHVILDLNESLLEFTKDGVVLRYYTQLTDPDVFVLSHSTDHGWYFNISDADTAWVPADGCEWSFTVNRNNRAGVLTSTKGVLND